MESTAKARGDDKGSMSVKLTKSDTDWHVASASNYPGKKDKVDEVLKKLLAIKVKSPIATQAANHNALRVGKDTYGKEVVVTAGSDIKKLTVGSGSGSAINVRFSDQNDVFQGRGISEYQLSSAARSYVETQYVKVEPDKVNAFQVTNSKGPLTFRKDGGKWMLEQLPAGAELDESKVTSFLTSTARVTLDRPIGKEVKPEFGLDSGAKVEIQATVDEKPVTVSYKVGAQAGAADSDGFYVKAGDNDFVVVATKWATEGPRTKGAEDFVKKPEQAQNGEGGPPGGMPPGMQLPPGMQMPPGMGGPPPGYAPPDE